MITKRTLLGSLAGLLLATVAADAGAQSYPSAPVKLIV